MKGLTIMENNRYESAFSGRYASPEMQYLFSADKKFSTWRKLWISLAKAEKAMGLDITDAQIAELEAHVDDIDYKAAGEYEKKLRHHICNAFYNLPARNLSKAHKRERQPRIGRPVFKRIQALG